MVNLHSWSENERSELEKHKKDTSDRLKTQVELIILGKANASDLSNVVLSLIFFILFLFVERNFSLLSLYFPFNYLLAFTIFYGLSHWLVNRTVIERYLNNFESAYLDCVRRSYSEMYHLEASKEENFKGILIIYFEEEHVAYVVASKSLIKSNLELAQVIQNLNQRLLNMRNLNRFELLQTALKDISLL